MKKKVIRLNENDIENLVKKVIKEDQDSMDDLVDIVDNIIAYGRNSLVDVEHMFEDLLDISESNLDPHFEYDINLGNDIEMDVISYVYRNKEKVIKAYELIRELNSLM